MRVRKSDTRTIGDPAVRAQLALLLTNARSLDSFSVDMLARSYRLPLKDIEYALTIARQKRAASEAPAP